MKKETPGVRYVKRSILAVGLLLPTLSLVPFGSIWLWQHGYLLHWAAGACLVTALAFAFQSWLLREPPARRQIEARAQASGDDRDSAHSAADPAWSPIEEAAWRDVLDAAERVVPAELTGRDAVIALGQSVVERVARRLHPEVKDPLWQFTVPEALALVERVAARMTPLIRDSVPLGDRLTVGQVLTIYRWRGLLDTANKAYDVWRVVRFLNPLSAATNELREQISRRMYEWGRDELARRLARSFVKEVGRASIDLYGGRLRVSAEALETYVAPETRRERLAAVAGGSEPLRVLIAGQTGAGKSSLVNALVRETVAAVDVLPATSGFAAHELKVDGVASAVIVDSPGVDEAEDMIAEAIEGALRADLIVWVLSAARADRSLDRRVLDAMRARFEERVNRRKPAVLVALTHVDRLRPFLEWAPPYNFDADSDENAKAVSIRDARRAAASDLGIDAADIVPLALRSERDVYNVDALWAKIETSLPDALRSRLVRALHGAGSERSWRSIIGQVRNAGRTVVKTLSRN